MGPRLTVLQRKSEERASDAGEIRCRLRVPRAIPEGLAERVSMVVKEARATRAGLCLQQSIVRLVDEAQRASSPLLVLPLSGVSDLQDRCWNGRRARLDGCFPTCYRASAYQEHDDADPIGAAPRHLDPLLGRGRTTLDVHNILLPAMAAPEVSRYRSIPGTDPGTTTRMGGGMGDVHKIIRIPYHMVYPIADHGLQPPELGQKPTDCLGSSGRSNKLRAVLGYQRIVLLVSNAVPGRKSQAGGDVDGDG